MRGHQDRWVTYKTKVHFKDAIESSDLSHVKLPHLLGGLCGGAECDDISDGSMVVNDLQFT